MLRSRDPVAKKRLAGENSGYLYASRGGASRRFLEVYSMDQEKSCGAVVFTRRNGRPMYVLVREASGACSFPKGHMEAGETEMQTAVREVYEETGLRPVFLDGFRETDEYDLREKPGTRKQVVYFLAEFHDGPLVPRPGEITDILLLPYGEAVKHFKHAGSRRVLAAADRRIAGK